MSRLDGVLWPLLLLLLLLRWQFPQLFMVEEYRLRRAAQLSGQEGAAVLKLGNLREKHLGWGKWGINVAAFIISCCCCCWRCCTHSC